MGNPDCPAEEMDAEDPLFILYTSGTRANLKELFIPVVAIWFIPITLL